MDDAASAGEAISCASGWGANDKAISDGVRQVTSENGNRDMSEMRSRAAVENNFVERVCFAIEGRRRSRGGRVGGVEAYFESVPEENSGVAHATHVFALHRLPSTVKRHRACA